jgi:hypothetical protein
MADTAQPSLFDTQSRPVFDGDTFEPARDAARLAGQLARVRQLMADGAWRTLREIAIHVGASEAGASARLRDLRKARFGGHTVERKYVADGLFAYRVVEGE